ncbi:CHASE3 domain-containing protein [Stutzerimonas urumqiensis]|uniref:ATP-binding protein n=1 Tax=Stutzerimonas urumqiensis TaxID=638269 RepID=UPI003DA54EF5
MQASPRLSWHSLAFAIACVLLVALAWHGARTQRSLLEANESVRGSLELITSIQAILSSLQDVETGQRGYILTGEPIYLEPYTKGRLRLARERQALEQRLGEDEDTAAWLAELDQAVADRLNIAASNIDARRELGLEIAVERARNAGGREAMDRIRRLLGAAEAHERGHLEQDRQALAERVAYAQRVAVLGGLVVALLMIGAFWAIRRNLIARHRLALLAQAGQARVDALLQAVPDSLYEIDRNGTIRPLSPASGERTAAPLAIEPVLRDMLSRDGSPRALTRDWCDEDGHTFEIRLVPTGLDDHLAIARDVTEPQRNRQRLQDHRAFLRSVVDADENLIYVRDALGRFQLCNLALAQLLDLSPEAVEGRQPRDLAAGHLLMPLLDGDQDLLEHGGAQRHAEIPVTDSAGQERWFQLTKRPLRLSDGSVQVVAVAIDITDWRQIQRLKSEFVSTVSHELRTPLTAIRGGLGMLIGGIAGEVPPTMRPLLDIAHKNSERLVRLINDILDIEKLEAGRLVLEMAPVEVLPLVEQALTTNEPYAREFQVSLALQQPAEGGVLALDADRFAQVMANLLSNAIKHSPAGGVVTVSCERHGDHLEIAVTDRGQGIPEAFRGRIFERFAQADASDVRSRGGTGLGLAITRSLVEQMHGTIGFDTETGRGTRFHLRFPLNQPAAVPAVSPNAIARPAAIEGQRILIVEPDVRAAEQLAVILRQHGYATRSCRTPQEAREWLLGATFQALTLSPNLSDEQGVAFLRDLREEPGLRQLPVLVVSLQQDGEADSDTTAVRGGAVGVMDWLREPVDAARVVAVMRACLVPGQRPNILHVEDDPDLRTLVANQLAGLDADLWSAGSVAEAREQLAQRPHELVLLDLMLPDGDGSELLDDLSRNDPPIPVIIFSALDEPAAENHLVLRRLVKSRHDGSELAALIQHYLSHWPGPPATSQGESP